MGLTLTGRLLGMNGKRIFSLLLSAILCFSLASGVFADEPEPLVICLDPGHGARDSGAVATYDGVEYQEADMVLRIALYLRAELESYENVKVIMTRVDRQGELPTINPEKVKPRIDYAVQNGADVVISLHLNALENPETHGVMMLTSNGYYNKECAEVGIGLGTNLLLSLTQLGLLNRGHLKLNSNDYRNPNGTAADYYAIVREGIWQNIPSLIVEHCYLTNEDDFRNYLSTDAKLHTLALADAEGIANYYGLQKKADSPRTLIDYSEHWAANAIDTAVHKGWVNGYPDNTFRPNNTLTRADFVTLLARLSGELLEAVTESPFPDVPVKSYYAESVAWAVKAGIINGFEDGTFLPKEPITREQMAHIMTLYLKHKGMDVQATDDCADKIPDLDQIHAYAKNDVLFCYANDLLKGKGDGFVPQGNATRAEACTIMLRISEYLDAHTAQPTDNVPPAEGDTAETPAPDASPAPTDDGAKAQSAAIPESMLPAEASE